MKTILIYKLNGIQYRKVFPHQVSRGTIEQFLVMEKRLGLSQHREAMVEIQNALPFNN
jgi:hypothetical protein